MQPSFSLFQHLARSARDRSQALALATADEELNFGELRERALSLGPVFAEGSAPIVALAAGNRDLAFAAYGASAACRAFWPLDPAFGDARWPVWQALAGRQAERLAALPTAGIPWTSARETAPELALVVATSGSSGEAKAVMLSQGNLDAAAEAANRCLELEPGDLWLNCLPLFHVGGLAILWRTARAGAAVFLLERFGIDAVSGVLASRPVTHISLVPAMLTQLVDAGIRPPASLRVALIGGAALAESLFRKATEAGWPLHPSWGMTETAAQVAAHRPRDGCWRPGLAGRPSPAMQVRDDADGRLWLAGPQVMLGYLNPSLRPGLGLIDGWFATGDLGRVEDREVEVLGRADDVLVSGGTNVHPVEIESALAACPGVREVAAAGIPDPVWGDLVVAIVAGTAEPATLVAWSRAHLRPAARPRRIVPVAALPRLAGGKIDRQALRHLALEYA